MRSRIAEAGFTDIRPLLDVFDWNGLVFTRREGSHGLGPVVEKMGPVMGFTLAAQGEPSLYWTGDTVLYPPVAKTIAETSPDIVVTHSCGAKWDGDLIVMDAEQTIATCELAKACPRRRRPYGSARSRNGDARRIAPCRRSAEDFGEAAPDPAGR